MKTMQRKLLEHLENVEEIDYCPLLEYFKEFHPVTQTDDFLAEVKTTLETLHDKKYIRFKDTDVQIGWIGLSRNHDGVMKTVTLDFAMELWPNGFKGKITNEGRHYLSDIIRNEKQDELNASFKKMNDETIPRNNTIQICLTGAIVLATIVTVIISALTYIKDKENRKSQDLIIQSLTDKQKSTEELLNKKVVSDSVFQKVVNNSLKSILERTK
jgi:hypothetical protein